MLYLFPKYTCHQAECHTLTNTSCQFALFKETIINTLDCHSGCAVSLWHLVSKQSTDASRMTPCSIWRHPNSHLCSPDGECLASCYRISVGKKNPRPKGNLQSHLTHSLNTMDWEREKENGCTHLSFS